MSGNRLICSQIFRDWLSSSLGQALLESEAEQLGPLINKLFGYHLILLGEPQFSKIIKSSAILHRVWLHLEIGPSFEGSTACARQDKLPLMTDEADLVVLAHCLEAQANPHEVLREVYRILKPEGQVVIVGFNPWSLWGVWRLLVRYLKRRPWDGRFIPVAQLKDWLALLGFDVVATKMCLFYPPVSNLKLLQRLKWMEWFGKWINFGGGSYIILAQKRVMALTPIKPEWQKKREAMSVGLVEPATRLK